MENLNKNIKSVYDTIIKKVKQKQNARIVPCYVLLIELNHILPEITIQELKIALQNLVKTDFLTYGKTLNDYWFLPNLTKKMPKN